MRVREPALCRRWLVLSLGWLILCAVPAAGVDLAGTDLAQRWEPQEGSLPAAAGKAGGRPCVRFTCDFDRPGLARGCWDCALDCDLADVRGVTFDLFWRDAAAIGAFTLYLHSGKGWYSTGFSRGRPGWNTITIDKAATQIGGKVAGWAHIDRIRLAASRGDDARAEFCVAGLARWGRLEPVVIVRAEAGAGGGHSGAAGLAEHGAVLARTLDRLGMPANLMADLDLTPSRLAGRTLLILPANPDMPELAANAIARFVRRGGEVIAFYGLPEALRPVSGIGGGQWMEAPRPGAFASVRPAQGMGLAGAPAVFHQRSWNIIQARPVEGRSRVLAWWHDEDGVRTQEPAIVASDRWIQMTHVLLDQDPAGARHLLLSLVARLVPDAPSRAARAAIEGVGRWRDLDGEESIARAARAAMAGSAVLAALDRAKTLRAHARGDLAAGRAWTALGGADRSGVELLGAYASLQSPRGGERRAIWCHSPWGVPGATWDEVASRLAAGGFTTLLVNMLWGGSAAYPSGLLPRAPEAAGRPDPLSECLAACRRHGIALHVWKVCWNLLDKAPAGDVARLAGEHRLQVDRDGHVRRGWLCPSNPANQRLEIESLLEVADRYRIAGVHLDYIRYPGEETCFCAGCRARFEARTGERVDRWPADVLREGPPRRSWLEFRRSCISRVVEAVSTGIHSRHPSMQVSAAVFPDWPRDRDALAQDWKTWCDKGYLDAVYPMDYVSDDAAFSALVARQRAWAGRVPCLPGIGLSVWPASTAENVVEVIDQVQRARQAHTPGFALYGLDEREMRDILPYLAAGLTRR